MNEIKHTLVLTQQEIDLALDALSYRPFRDVHMLIANILQQFRAQNPTQE